MTQEQLVSFCGINCLECPAYVAKRTDDNELREKTARGWSRPDFFVAPEEINCDGCITTDQELFKHCNVCQVRICGSEKSVQNCAHCNDYSCEKLEGLWTLFNLTEPKEILDSIRNNLT